MRIRVFSLLSLVLLLYLNAPAFADTDFIQLSGTGHEFSGGNGSLSMDGNFSTVQEQYSSGEYDSNAEVISTHTFTIPRTITLIEFKMAASAYVYGDDEQVADIHWNVQYLDPSGWHVVSGSQYDGSTGGNSSVKNDSGDVQLAVNLSNVTAIKAWARGHSHSNGDSHSNESHAYIYEIRAYGIVDIGLRAFDGTTTFRVACEPQGGLTSPLRVAKNNMVYAITLVDSASPHASKIRVRTSSGIKAIEKIN